MAYTPISELPDTPSRQLDDSTTFSNKTDAFLTALPTFRTEVNNAGDYIDAAQSSVTKSTSDSAQSALDSANSAVNASISATAAAASSMYQGIWEDLGAIAGVVGGTYSHNSAIWLLEKSLSDISTQEPVAGNEYWYLVNEEPLVLPCPATMDWHFAEDAYTIYNDNDGFIQTPIYDQANFERDTDGSFVNPRGGISELGVDKLRRTFDGETGEAFGALIEESRTRLNTIYIEPTTTETVSVTAQNYTISFYGSGSVALSGAHSETIVGVDDKTRSTLTFTPAEGSLVITPTGSVRYLQLEEGGFATSVILGSEGAAVTRGADNLSRTLGDEFNSDEFTVYFEGEMLSTKEKNPNFFTIGINSSTRLTAYLSNSSGLVAIFYKTPSGSYANENMPISDRISISVSKAESAMIFSSGGVVFSTPLGFDISQAFTDLLIGSFGISERPTQKVKRFAIYPRAFDAETLQRMTRGGI